MTNNNWIEEFNMFWAYDMCNQGEFDEIKNFISNLLTKKDQEHKAELESIKEEIEIIDEQEIETDDGSYIFTGFIQRKDTIAILDSHINKTISPSSRES